MASDSRERDVRKPVFLSMERTPQRARRVVALELCSREFTYPDECPCCGAIPDLELAIPLVIQERTRRDESPEEIPFVYCAECIDHVSVWRTGSMVSSVTTALGIVACFVLVIVESALTGMAALGVAVAFAVVEKSIITSHARSRSKQSCACVEYAVTYGGWSGSTTMFAFESPAYAASFAEHNRMSLVGSAEPLRLLEAHEIARRHVPTPAAPLRVLPQPHDARGWSNYIANRPNRITRRVALKRALDVVADESDRTTLVEAVSRSELAPIFDELDQLGIAGRRRRLQRALAMARFDNMPNALRVAQIRELERRLRVEPHRELS
jgi:hypothetical protein